MNTVHKRLKESIAVKESFAKTHEKDLESVADTISFCFNKGGKLLIIGNGGSAADAQHMAAEFTGRFSTDRDPLPAIALTTDTSALTAIGNDYGYDEVFSRQVRALTQPMDVLFAISTSGNSTNVIKAVENFHGSGIISLTGGTGGKLALLSDINLIASLGKDSATIQETHIWAIHTIITLFEEKYCK
jgi:D-sedoheptulose 7-phosphate isomerase